MAEFLDGERLHPLWEPAEIRDDQPACDPGDISRLADLRIPQTPAFRTPDMLLYQLGRLEVLDPAFSDRLADFVAGDHHTCVCLVSRPGY